MLGITDRVDAPRFLLRLAHRRKLGERGHSGLVDHEILAVAHDRNAEPGALARDRGRDDDRDAVVLDDLARIIDALCLRVPLGEGLRRFIIGSVKSDEFRPGFAHELDLHPDVRVVEADGGKSKRTLIPGHALQFPSATKPNGLAIAMLRRKFSKGEHSGGQ